MFIPWQEVRMLPEISFGVKHLHTSLSVMEMCECFDSIGLPDIGKESMLDISRDQFSTGSIRSYQWQKYQFEFIVE